MHQKQQTEGQLMTTRNSAAIILTGWLNEVKSFDWGTALRVSADVRRTNDQGEWETVDKLSYDVTTAEPFQSEARQVTVTGRITGLNIFQKKDGSTGVSIKVRADSIEEVLGDTPSTQAVEENDLPF